ncbi:MAG: hypothetical protein ACLGQU_14585 [Acidobacteriota bacterium]
MPQVSVHPYMKQLALVALAVAVFALPAWAQRVGGISGGAAGGGHGGGGSFHAAFAGRGAFSPRSNGVAGRGAASQLEGRRTGRAWPSSYNNHHPGSGAYPRRWRQGRYGIPYNYRGGYGYGYPGGYGYGGLGFGWPLASGWVDTNDPGYDDDDQSYDDDSSSDTSADGGDGTASSQPDVPYGPGDDGPDNYYGPGAYGPIPYGPSTYGSSPEGSGQGVGGEYYPYPPVPYLSLPTRMVGPEGRSLASSPMQPAISRVPSLYDSSAVTLVFKDGRPPEKIYNYALTRTMLYVADGKHQQIPISELNLAATQKVNQQNGVSFQLPQ